MKEPKEYVIVINGRVFESGPSVLARLRISEWHLKGLLQRGLPQPIRIGRKRYFETESINEWLLASR